MDILISVRSALKMDKIFEINNVDYKYVEFDL